ncbi:MAG: hydroxymethylbilane synthase [Actinobacteria bacterium HGW-Actinobacteria-4]|nr:MAG: hydroxymethylbilane synthase [Actinobacteria bacterium HGW-Actinobacteria-4]
MKLRLGTRASTLATTQSGMVADALVAAAASRGTTLDVELVEITTEGDTSTGSLVGLSQVGVFVNALRDALIAGECDLIVHSLKDMPVDPHPDLSLAALVTREDVRDALCTGGIAWEELAEGATVGTSSPRRAAQLRALRPDLRVVDIRGNVDTRLSKLGNGFDAVVLAAAGLKRLGRLDEATHLFSPDQMLPAPGQGALAVEIAADADDDLRSLVTSLDDADTRAAVTAERAALAVLDGGCAVPVAALAIVDGLDLRLHVRIVNTAGTLMLNEVSRGVSREALSIGRSSGHALLGRGAARLMEST